VTRLLSLDSSTSWGGVALVEGDALGSRPIVIAETGIEVRDSHASRLLVMAESLLAQAGWARSSIDAYCATRGPGSFTGLRVGLGTARGLAVASSRTALGIGTLEAMAEALGPVVGQRVPLMDASRGEIYGAVYDEAGTPPTEVVPPWVGPPESAIGVAEGSAVLFGRGAELYSGRLREAGWSGVARRAPAGVAGAAGRLAFLRLAAGASDGEGMSPLYLRPADAELAR
jgi:tRNA threonylcarbamoyladenosine biosynthesis protein TsaB